MREGASKPAVRLGQGGSLKSRSRVRRRDDFAARHAEPKRCIFDGFWTVESDDKWIILARVVPLIVGTMAAKPVKGVKVVTERLDQSISTLHKRWAKLEDEHHQLAKAIDEARIEGVKVAPMRERQAKLLLEIASAVAEIRDAPAATTEDFVALLDVALEHELDLASDIAFYGPSDYPMTARLLRALALALPGFEFNSLRRWLSSPGQYDQLMGDATPFAPARDGAEPVEQVGFW